MLEYLEYIIGAIVIAYFVIRLLCEFILDFLSRIEKLVFKRIDAKNEAERNAKREAELEVVGQTGIAMTTLRPQGYVRINDQRHDAMVENYGFIEANQPVTVVKKQGDLLIVKSTQ